MTTAVLSCLSGSAMVYPSNRVLMAGQDETFDVENQAREAPAIGHYENGPGMVRVQAIGGRMVVREYLAVNPFSGSEAENYTDRTLDDGDSVTAEVIRENVKTLVVMKETGRAQPA